MAISNTDAATNLLQSLSTKIERVQLSIQDQTKIVLEKQKEFSQLQHNIEKLQIEENRITEYLNTLGEPDWSRLCSITPPEAFFTIQIIVSPSSSSEEAAAGGLPSSTTPSSIMTVGLPSIKHRLHGKTFTTSSIGSARCLASYLRNDTFIPPSEENELLEVFHLANDYNLDNLSILIKDFLLNNLQQPSQ